MRAMALIDDAIAHTARRIVQARAARAGSATRTRRARDRIVAHMPAQRQFLGRGPDGRMVTIVAFSTKGAKEAYLRKYKPRRGDSFSIKERGVGDWVHFRVTG